MPGIKEVMKKIAWNVERGEGWHDWRSLSQLQEPGPMYDVFRKVRSRTMCARDAMQLLRMSSTVNGAALHIWKSMKSV